MAFYYRFLKILLNKVLNIIKHMAKDKASKEEKRKKKKSDGALNIMESDKRGSFVY